MSDAPLYVPCPRCKGDRLVWACTNPGNDFAPSSWDSFDCPLCYATGEADRNMATAWVEARAEEDE
jgi:hypothetical protein